MSIQIDKGSRNKVVRSNPSYDQQLSFYRRNFKRSTVHKKPKMRLIGEAYKVIDHADGTRQIIFNKGYHKPGSRR